MVDINGIFPYMYKLPGKGHHIFGELYRVTEKTLQKLDWLEGVPDHYFRELIIVDTAKTRMRAWCYFSKTIHVSDGEFLSSWRQ